MRTNRVLVTLALCAALAVALGLWLRWRQQDAPRLAALAVVAQLHDALQAGNQARLLDRIQLPAALQSRTAAEQTEFLAKALRDELSAEGLAELKRHATFGPLKQLFPAEADAWATQAGVNPNDRVAFKLDRDGQRAEVVLARVPDLLHLERGEGGRRPDEVPKSSAFRLVRVNNVKQLAARH